MNYAYAGFSLFSFPFNLQDLIERYPSSLSASSLTPQEVLGLIEELTEEKNFTWLLRAYVLQSLSSKRVLLEYRLSPTALLSLVSVIRRLCATSLVPAGESAGMIAALSLSKSFTQNVLTSSPFQSFLHSRDPAL